MTTLRTRITIPLAIAAAMLLAPALTGCGVLGGGIEGIIEQATDGQVDLGGQSIPEGFPDDVPVIDGEIIYGVGINPAEGGNVWSILVKVDSLEVIDDIASDLEAAGFTKNEDIGGTTKDGATAIYSSDAYTVHVLIGEDPTNGFVATYTVGTVQ